MKRTTFLIPALALAVTTLAFGALTQQEDSQGRVICGHARFTRLADGMLRIEHAKDGVFDDRPTLRAWTMPEPAKFDKVEFNNGGFFDKVLKFLVAKFGGDGSEIMGVVAETPLYKVQYVDADAITNSYLKIEWKAGGKEGTYTWGQLDYENLGGINGMDHVYEAQVGSGKVNPAGDWAIERLSELPMMYTMGAISKWCGEHKGEYEPKQPILWSTFRDYDKLPEGLKKICDVWLIAPPGPISRAGYGTLDETFMYMYDKDTQWLDLNVKDGYVNFFFFCYGNDYRLAMQEYSSLLGKCPLLPRWAYGSWHSRNWPYKADEIKEVVKKYREYGLPLDVLIIDIDWHLHGWSGFDWNKENFPNPEEFMAWAHKEGLYVGLNLHSETLSKQDGSYFEMAKMLGFDPANPPMIAVGQKDKNWLDKKLGVNTWDLRHSDEVYAVDYLDKKVWDAFQKACYEPNDKIGIDFWWQDNWQGLFPHVNHNLWLHELMWRRHMEQGKRPIALNRYAGLGSHRYPAYFSGDTGSHWPVLKYECDVNRRAAQVGMNYFSHDLGGFVGEVLGQDFGHISPELFVRWMQMGALCPVMRIHSNYGIREAWNYSPFVCKLVKNAYSLHHKLVPYFYHLAREAYETCWPIQRPVYFLYPEDEKAYSYTHSYFVGDKLFFAPVDNQGGFMDITLPQGEYFDYFTGEEFKGGDRIKKQFKPAEMPLYVRKGSLIPNMDQSERVGVAAYDPLVMAVYPGGDDTIAVYEDDGLCQDYDKNYSRLPFSLKDGKDALVVASGPVKGSFTGMKTVRNVRFDFYFAGEPEKVLLDGQEVNWEKKGDKCVGVLASNLDVTKDHNVTFIKKAEKNAK